MTTTVPRSSLLYSFWFLLTEKSTVCQFSSCLCLHVNLTDDSRRCCHLVDKSACSERCQQQMGSKRSCYLLLTLTCRFHANRSYKTSTETSSTLSSGHCHLKQFELVGKLVKVKILLNVYIKDNCPVEPDSTVCPVEIFYHAALGFNGWEALSYMLPIETRIYMYICRGTQHFLLPIFCSLYLLGITFPSAENANTRWRKFFWQTSHWWQRWQLWNVWQDVFLPTLQLQVVYVFVGSWVLNVGNNNAYGHLWGYAYSCVSCWLLRILY